MDSRDMFDVHAEQINRHRWLQPRSFELQVKEDLDKMKQTLSKQKVEFYTQLKNEGQDIRALCFSQDEFDEIIKAIADRDVQIKT